MVCDAGLPSTHVHCGGGQANDPDYVYKLAWVTASRPFVVFAAAWTGTSSSVSCRQRTKSSHRASSRITGRSLVRGSQHAADAGDGTRMGAIRGEEGQRWIGAHDPEIMAALLDESKKFGLGSTAHLDQMGVGRMNALQASRLGLVDLTHYYGLFESLLKDYSIQPYPVTQNYNDEQHRFGQVARLWDKIHPRGSERWNALSKSGSIAGSSSIPRSIYSASRDVMRMRQAEWHDKYTLPSLWDFYQPNRNAHGSHFGSTPPKTKLRGATSIMDVLPERLQERRWPSGNRLRLRVIYQTHGFGYISRVRDAAGSGTPPLEVVRAATLHGAETLHEPKDEASTLHPAGGSQGRYGDHEGEPAAELQDPLCDRTSSPD